jgi:sigma-E factor negative regulatory protein RseA
LAGGTLPAAFLGRLRPRLPDEPRLIAQAPGEHAPAAMPARRAASNDAAFRWKLVAGFASLSAVAAVGWGVVVNVAGKPEQAQLASVPTVTVPVANAQGPMIRDPRLDEFLAAHRQLAGESALQTPAGFLRNAAFESGSR